MTASDQASPLAGRLRRGARGLLGAGADRAWRVAVVAAVAAVAVLHLSGLGVVPPGLYVDESSVGYNAWAISHHLVDEHGVRLPLYFEAFGEWKNPVYIYLLAPFTSLLPMSAAVVRLPAALCGIAVTLITGRLVWERTRSRPATLLTLLSAGVTPWLVVESRLGFEVISMVVALSVALWALSRSDATEGPRAALVAGLALSVTVLSYTSARALVPVLVVTLVLTHGTRWRRAWLWLVPVIVAVTFVGIGLWAAANPGALSARFSLLGIGSDGPPLTALVERVARNYTDYVGPRFLLTRGDPNPRHGTGAGGMLLVTTLPALLAGVAHCVRGWGEPFHRLLLVGAVLGPLPAALTAESTPHSLRAAGMLPFLLVLTGLGWKALADLVASAPARAVAATLVIALAGESGYYLEDLFVRWPGRSVVAFDASETDAIVLAHDVAGGHRVLLSSTLDAPAIQAAVSLLPSPPTEQQAADPVETVCGLATARPDVEAARLLAPLGMCVGAPDAVVSRAQPGDAVVLDRRDQAPVGLRLVREFAVDVAPEDVGIGRRPMHVVLAVVYVR